MSIQNQVVCTLAIGAFISYGVIFVTSFMIMIGILYIHFV